MQERDTSGFAGGAHKFSHYDRVFFFDVCVRRRRARFQATQCCDEGPVGQMIVTLGGRAHACRCSPSSFGLHNCNFLCMCGSRMSEVSSFVLIPIS